MHQHYKGVHLNDPFRCRICDETFIYYKSRTKHEKNKHGIETGEDLLSFKYNCDVCGEWGSDDKTEYTRHVDAHKGVKRYACSMCMKSYATANQLTNHVKKCGSEKHAEGKKNDMYECSVTTCGKKFGDEDKYREHFKGIHVDAMKSKVFYCEVCIVRYFSVEGYEKHLEKCRG